MAEELFVPMEASRKEKYEALIPQIEALLEGEHDKIANLANLTAVLKTTFDFFWIGFYRMIDGELVLGPFQGSLACTRIPLSRGICGFCAREQRTIIVADVNEFPGHIACSSLSKSEIVVPLIAQGKVELVLDIDSNQLDDFDEIDAKYLEQIIEVVRKKYW